MTILAILAALVILIMLRVPVAVSLLGVSILYLALEPSALSVVVQRMTSGLESFPLLSIPLFVLAGSIMARGGLAERLMGFATVLVGHFRGGLAQVNVLNSFLIGGMSGSAQSDAAIDSKVLVPIMRRSGYSNAYASALTAASSTVSPILPPSIALILYGVLADVSIGALFIAGVLPAIAIALALSVTVRILAHIHDHPRANDRPPRFPEIIRSFWSSLSALLMPILLLIGLRIGVFTPTELSAVAVVYALFVSLFIYKQIRWRDVPRILVDSALTTALLLFIVAAASVFAIVVAHERIPAQIETVLGPLQENPLLLLLIINLLLLVLGALIDAMSLMIILSPVLAPIAVGAGIDPIQFGLILVVNVVIGSVTPPVGSTLFTVMSITGVKMPELVKAFLPLYLALLFVLFAISVIPALTTWLPSLL